MWRLWQPRWRSTFTMKLPDPPIPEVDPPKSPWDGMWDDDWDNYGFDDEGNTDSSF